MKDISKYLYGAALGCAALLFTWNGPARAQPAAAPSVTLGEVLEVAVRQRPSLAEAAIDVAVADAAVLRAAGLEDWYFDARASWSSSRYQVLNIRSYSVQVGASIQRMLPTGGTVSLHAQTGYTQAAQTYYDDTLGVGLTQPLMRGFGSRIALAQQRQAAIDRDAAELRHRRVAVIAVREVVTAYWELVYALRDLEIRRGSLELAQERLRNTQVGIQAGAVAPTEALAVEQIIATREQEIVASELAIIERSLDLRRRAGLEIGPGAVELTTSAPLTVQPRRLDLHALIARAYAHSPEIAELERRQDRAYIEVELAEDGLRPDVELSLSVGPTGAGETPGEALSQMMTFEDLTYRAGLTVRHSLGNRAARGGLARAQAEVSRHRLTLADARAQLASLLAVAVKQAEAAEKRITLSARAVALAEQNIEAEKARFDLGRSTNFDVLMRQDELKLAQLREARAVIDYMAATTAIDAVTGDILDRYGITVTPREPR